MLWNNEVITLAGLRRGENVFEPCRALAEDSLAIQVNATVGGTIIAELTLEGGSFVMVGLTGRHSVLADDVRRADIHWNGFVEANAARHYDERAKQGAASLAYAAARR